MSYQIAYSGELHNLCNVPELSSGPMYTEVIAAHDTGSVVHCAEDAADIGIQVGGY